MFKNVLCVLFLIFIVDTALAVDKFDSAHSVAMDGVIPEGILISRQSNEYYLQQEIKNQLMYTIGQLNGLEGGAPDMNRLESKVLSVEPMKDGYFKVVYSAKLFIAWPREQTVPNGYQLILPKRGDRSFLQQFQQQFGSDENGQKKCLAWDAHDVTQDIFWYYYRPQNPLCPLRMSQTRNSQMVQLNTLYLNRSAENTNGKSPEYDKVWEDGRLVITAIFGKGKEGVTANNDPGISAYRNTAEALVATFGQPVRSNQDIYSFAFRSQTNDHPELKMVFQTPKGEVDVHLYLLDGIQQAPMGFYGQYNQRTQISDFISYSGHSGLGANIRALASMGRFTRGQYQVFLVNGCDTFAYVDDSLRNAHAAVNPGYSKDKFIDVITNAMPSFFHMNTRSNMAVINALYAARQTYKQILSGFHNYQRAVVTGEQDN